MSNLLAPMAALVALSGGIVYGMVQTPEPIEKPVANFKLPDHKSSQIWALSSQDSDEICIITKTDRISLGTTIIDVDPTCAELTASLLDIEAWQQDRQGNVSLVNDQGISIYQFTVSETQTGSLKSTEQQNLELSPLS